MRLSPTTGEPVDFVWSEAARALLYINDLMDQDWCQSHSERVAFFDAIRQCYPYYMANMAEHFMSNEVEYDTMRPNGFHSSNGTRECRRMSDGSLCKRPADMQPDAAFIKIL